MPWNEKWIGGLLVLLGAYLVLNNLVLSTPPAHVFYHDLIVSALLVICGAVYGSGRGARSIPWCVFLLGCYLQLAPVLLWTPQPVQFLNQTGVGIIAAAVGALLPFAHLDYQRKSPLRPLGWSYNPSAWSQRLPVFICCVICFAIASYMAVYHLGYKHEIWDPIFGEDGTVRVITSPLSRSLPISDAGLGMALYAVEALCVWKGGVARWYTAPAFVLFFGLLVIPGGIVSILLIISQPIIVGYWCLWCLLTAAFMLCMIAFTVDEVFAAIQFLVKTRQEKPEAFWHTLMYGGALHDPLNVNPEDIIDENQSLKGLFRGISISPALVLSSLIGATLLIIATLRGIEDTIAHTEDIIGPLIITVSVIAMAEVMRPIRYINILFGAVLCVMPFFVDTFVERRLEVFVAGLALILSSLPQGKLREHYGLRG